jgi:O-methyltransferase
MQATRNFVLNHFHKFGLKNSKRLLKYSYAILLSDFLHKHRNVPKFNDRFLMYDQMIDPLHLNSQALQYFEFGVYQGKSIKYWLSKNQNPASSFYGFDSFEGLPEYWSPTMQKGAFNVQGQIPQIDDNRVRFIKGWFNQTLPSFLKTVTPHDGKRIILHLDADLYSSTYYVLNYFFFQGFIKKDTILIFDEVVVASIADTEFRAFYDFMEVMNLDYDVLGISTFEMAIRIK